MTGSPGPGLLDRADSLRAAGRRQEAAGLYEEAARQAREAGDLQTWTEAVLGGASVHVFGAEPGRVPAQLYDVLARTTDPRTRARLCAALARTWVYGSQAGRAGEFAREAVAHAERVGDPALLADCLDAALATHWGPDEVEIRRRLAGRLAEVAAHVLEAEARLQAHLWQLLVAGEALDVSAMHRQVRALELLGEESPRARFFAASRRLMLDLLRGRTDTAPDSIEIADAAARRAGLADAWMVLEAMSGYAAAQSGDLRTCAARAAAAEAFAVAEGVTPVLAEAAYLWVCADRPDRARPLVAGFGGRVMEDLPRDVNWLLTLQCVLQAALAVGDEDVITTATDLLLPYAGRAVFDAGAVMFHGMTDDPLSRALLRSGAKEQSDHLRERALAAYARLGATWWHDRLAGHASEGRLAARRRTHLHPMPGGLWLIGSEPHPARMRELRGFAHLRRLARSPGERIAALDLVGSGGPVVDQRDMGPVLDAQALRAYRMRIAELDEEIDEALEWSDLGRLEAAQGERDALVAQIAVGSGFGGRPRVTGGSFERARIAVTKAIGTAIAHIADVDPVLAGELRSSVHTGQFCYYEPLAGGGIEWVLDQASA